jgi:hypothetical protein
MSLVALLIALLVPMFTASTARAQETITIFPSAPEVGNCFPFGVGEPTRWEPFMAFFYRNIPAFELKTGDTVAFDLGAINDADVQLDIAMAATTENGGTQEAQPFQTVVTNTQTPANPRGDTIVGNFELRFIAEGPFSFPGGGLIIRFSNPSLAYQADTLCDAVLVHTDAPSDPSGFFVARAYNDPDGAAPWANEMADNMGAFQLVLDADCDADGLGDSTPDPNLFGGNCPARGRTATLDASKNKVKKGKKVKLTGRITEQARAGECQSGQTVELQRKKSGATSFKTIEQVITDATGGFSSREKVKKTYKYRAEVDPSAGCNGGVSNTEKVKVKKKRS